MLRQVKPELLDELSAGDDDAVGSRRDLRLLNRWMRSVRTLAAGLRRAFPFGGALRIADLGAGDGTLALRLVRRLEGAWRGSEMLLVDRQPLLTAGVQREFLRLGWSVQLIVRDARAAVEDSRLRVDAFIANLFLHHLPAEDLAALLRSAAAQACCFVAHEPRRWRVGLAAARVVGLLGCNRVTRHDAAVSVQAGFSGSELSALWPSDAAWKLSEGPAGPFGHLFVAAR